MNPQDPREVPTARKRSWPPPSSDVAAVASAPRDPLHESLATLLRTQRGGGVQAPLPIVSRVVSGMLRRLSTMHVANDAPSDVYGASVILWESLAGRPFAPRTAEDHEPPSRYRVNLDPAVDAIVARGLASGPMNRFESADEMAVTLEAAIPPATPTQIGAWVESLARESLDEPARPPANVEVPGPPPEVRPPAETIPAEPPFAPMRAEVLPPAPAPAPFDEPSIQLRLDPGAVDAAKRSAITRRVRSRPPPPIRRIAPANAGRHAVLVAAIAGAALLVAVCARWLDGERRPTRVAPRVESIASAPLVDVTAGAPRALDDVAPSTSSAAPVVPSTHVVTPPATGGAGASNAPARAPKAKRPPALTRDDVL